MSHHLRFCAFLAATVLVLAACGDDDSGDATTTTSTTTSTTEAVPVLPGTVFTTDEPTPVPGVSDLVGLGITVVSLGDEPGEVVVTGNGTSPIDDGTICMFCLETIILEPDTVVGVDPFFKTSTATGSSGAASISIQLSVGGVIKADSPAFLVAGPDGATLTMVEGGFVLVSGAASYVTDVTDLPEGAVTG